MSVPSGFDPFDMETYDDMKSKGEIVNTKDDWDRFNEAQEKELNTLIQTLIDMSGVKSDIKNGIDSAGAAIMFFVMVLGQKMMSKTGNKVAEESDKVAYLQEYLKAVNHLKELFNTATQTPVGEQRDKLTAQFKKEAQKLIDFFGGKTSADATTDGGIPHSASNIHTHGQKQGNLPDSAQNTWFDSDTNSQMMNSLQTALDTLNAGGDLTQIWIDAGTDIKGDNCSMVDNGDGTYTMTYYAQDEKYYKWSTDGDPTHAQKNNEWWDSGEISHSPVKVNGVDYRVITRTGTLEELTKDRTLLDSGPDACSVSVNGNKDAPDSSNLKKMLTAFDSMTTTMSSVSTQVQGSIQYDQGEYNKMVNVLRDIGSDLHKLEQSINNHSSK